MHGQIATGQKAEEEGQVDLHVVVDFLARRWRLILAVALSIVALTIVIMMTLTPRYTSTAQILLDPNSRQNLGGELSGLDGVLDPTGFDNQTSIISSVNFLRRVVEKEDLVHDPEFGDSAQSPSFIGAVFASIKSIFSSRDGASDQTQNADGVNIPPDVRASIRKLGAALSVSRITRTAILQVSVTSVDPNRAARLANAVADAFIVDQLENRYDAARRASTWLTDRLQSLRDSLRKSEEAVTQFRNDNKLFDVGGETTLNQQQLSEVNAELVKIQTEAAAKRAKYEQAEQIIKSGGNVEALPDVIHSAVIGDLRSRLAEVSSREADLVTRYGARHPLVVNVRAERREIERQIDAEVQRIVANLKNDYEVAQSRADAMKANVAAASGQSGQESTLTVHLRELERDAAANRTLYETFLNQAKLTSEQSQVNIQDARIITPALPSGTPSFPRTSIFLAMGAALGLVFGVGVAALLDMLNAGFNSPRQVEEQTGLAVLSTIEWVDTSEGNTEGVPAVNYLVNKPLSRFSESIRSLRAGIQMSNVDEPPRIVEVTSAAPGEGKSMLAISLAVSAATSGKRVLLIDCDLRRPSVTQQFGLTDRPGLVELLAQSASTDGILYRDKASGVYVLGSGAKTQNPPDLLGSARMQHLIEQLRETFDFVVLDVPPIGPVIDASVLAPLVDKVLFVVRWNATAREFVRHAIERLPGDRKVCGIALNMVDLRRTPRYGRYSYYSSAYYKKYYVG
ncbi:polysaccharide biosynthesis tyrosine autokinase [Ancylobacter mangrovi]|uniref:polysaccharide biosynthesis tyrosine autokinase n=1 Tax=Ancylobacter mangrovi TaxID=2972472 RepID=UPI002161DDE3|nr:polysaccharide biosynthesis tyrosine autokinase [Ancylobacter mangrovi]MCS0504491.1 polysaccharide biosynthesis tyrosine autokinase [Ancylobacter mangrovi]